MSDCPQLLTPVQQKHIQRQNNINQRRHKDGNFKKQQLQDEADKVLYKLGLMSLNGELWIKCGKNLDSYRLIVTSGHKVRNKLGLKSLNDEFWITSVITIDHFRKTHILNQNKPESEHSELLIKAKIITFISCGRYLEG